jgi:hypothetical protein
MKSIKIISLILLLCCGCRNSQEPWQILFNGKDLNGWDTWLGPEFDTLANDFGNVPVGLNMDPLDVFSIVDMDGEKVLRISGEQFGGISTKETFGNYHLQLQFKWGNGKHVPRAKDKRDSGLMYHAVGEQGADYGFWMRSQEFQIQEGDCGDYWACAGALADVNSEMLSDSSFRYNVNGQLRTFSENSPAWRNCEKNPDAEKPYGEWNTIDLYCLGDTSVHMVNGVVTMVLNNLQQLETGLELPLVTGKIQLQSEGAEIFYRNIKIIPIDKIPQDIL